MFLKLLYLNLLLYAYFNFEIFAKPKSKKVTASTSKTITTSFAGITENDLGNNYEQAFFGSDKEQNGENWKTLIRKNTAFLLNERINAALKKIEANKKLPKKAVKGLSEEAVNEKEKKEFEKIVESFKLVYKEFVEENQDKIDTEWRIMLNLLEYEKFFENLASENPLNNKNILINEEFESLESNLYEIGGDEYDNLEEHFKQLLANLHFERLKFTKQIYFI
ncbi:unnamed protein product [Meloidogyne enterolobii]|uniref:Uncharacterized protein n=1 Tax=Meloidogyne enterolobii TaxID=390850 RepID=A0ACB0ZHS3_MELEN